LVRQNFPADFGSELEGILQLAIQEYKE